MQPDQNLPLKPEAAPQLAVSSEKTRLPEKQDSIQAEQAPGVVSSNPPSLVTTNSQSLPVSTTPPATTPVANQTAVVDPSLSQYPAEDTDVIEKVWVEKSDQIIETKKDDPRAEDDAQHDLSRAYLKKRFNLDVN